MTTEKSAVTLVGSSIELQELLGRAVGRGGAGGEWGCTCIWGVGGGEVGCTCISTLLFCKI